MLVFIICYHFLQRQMDSNITNFERLSDQCKFKFDLLIDRYQNNNELEKTIFKSCKIC